MKNDKNKKVILIVIMVVLIIGIIGELIYYFYSNKDSFFEQKMISAAKKLDTGKEVYLTLENLNLSKDGCYDYSGILISKGSYYPNLICDNYKSKSAINNGGGLVGDEIMLLPVGINYVDPATNKPDDTVLKTIGVYTINYGKLIRKVVVLNNETLKGMYPKIKLNGDEHNYVFVNNSYDDLGVTASDTVDGILTDKVIKTGSIDTSKVGQYEIIYTVTNSKGFKNYIKREVEVYDLIYEYNELKENNSYLINFKFDNERYKEIQLPNGTTTSEKVVSYPISDNGTFEFSIVDDQGFKHSKTVTISDIDKEKPQLTCTVYLYDNNSKIVANATDDIGVTDYIYTYGNITSEKTSESSFLYNVKTSDTSVTVYDAISNSTTSKCNIIDSSTRYGRIYSQGSGTYPYWLYIPPTLTKRSSVPLVIFLHGSGEQGSNLEQVNRHGFPKFAKEGTDYPFIMAAPQTRNGWNASKVIQFTNEIINKYPEIDRRRIVLTGFSMGGSGTFITIRDYPDYFSLAVPVAGSAGYSTNFNKTVFRVYFGSRDSGSGLNVCKNTIRQISAVNPKSQLIILDGKDHVGSAQTAYSDQQLIQAIVNTYK